MPNETEKTTIDYNPSNEWLFDTMKESVIGGTESTLKLTETPEFRAAHQIDFDRARADRVEHFLRDFLALYWTETNALLDRANKKFVEKSVFFQEVIASAKEFVNTRLQMNAAEPLKLEDLPVDKVVAKLAQKYQLDASRSVLMGRALRRLMIGFNLAANHYLDLLVHDYVRCPVVSRDKQHDQLRAVNDCLSVVQSDIDLLMLTNQNESPAE